MQITNKIEAACSSSTSCTNCLENGCGWCLNSGVCRSGTVLGPSDLSCLVVSWAWGSNSACPNTGSTTSNPSQNPTTSRSATPSEVPTASPSATPSEVPTASPSATLSTPFLPFSLSFSSSFAFPFSSYLSFVSFSLPSSPRRLLHLSFYFTCSVHCLNSSSPFVDPREVSIPNSSFIAFPLTLRLFTSTPGIFSLHIGLSGPAADDYFLPSPAPLLNVIPSFQEPVTPSLALAQFGSDGSIVMLLFDFPTNRGGYLRSFACRSLLLFKGDSDALCYWESDQQISIQQSSQYLETLLGVGDEIVLKETITLRAACGPIGQASCNRWNTVKGKTVTLMAPTYPSLPNVQISAPTLLAVPCQPLRLDLTSSTGNAGRPWKVINITVKGDRIEDFTAINEYLVAQHSVTHSTVIPSSLFTPNTNYNFSVLLCNFLGGCSRKSLTVQVYNKTEAYSVLPQISFSGPSLLNLFVSYPLEVKAVVESLHTESAECRTQLAPLTSLTFRWKLMKEQNSSYVETNEIVHIPNRNALIFSLPPYTLAANQNYLLLLTTSSSFLPNRTSTLSTKIVVAQGNLIAVIDGGNRRWLQIGVTTILDGSQSYDEDQRTLSNSSLNYRWDCLEASFPFRLNCSNYLQFLGGVTSSGIHIRAMPSAVNTSLDLTLTVYDKTRSASTTVKLFTTSLQLNTISITTPTRNVRPISLINSKKLSISATIAAITPCEASWTVDDDTIDLTRIAITNTSKWFTTSIINPFNLVILDTSLLPLYSSPTFTLTCGVASSSIQIVTNAPPLPGQFSILPTSGMELTTNFALIASLWTDTDLPITYQFGFISPTTGNVLVVTGRSAASFSSSIFPAASPKLNSSLEVFDVYNATAWMFDQIIVQPLKSIISPNQSELSVIIGLMSQFMNASGNSVNGDSAKAWLSSISAVVNRVNCTGSSNCSSLFRNQCSDLPNVCGQCMEGYVEVDGDRNSSCALLSPRASDSLCRNDLECPSTLQICNVTSHTCHYMKKVCRDNCFGHGQCRYQDVNTGIPLPSCTVDDLSCEAVCACDRGFEGQSCEWNSTTLRMEKEIRQGLLRMLTQVMTDDVVTETSVSSWSEYLCEITNRADAIEVDDLALVMTLAAITTSSATSISVAPKTLLPLLRSLDDVTGTTYPMFLDLQPTELVPTGHITPNTLLVLLSQFTTLTMSQAVYGEPDISLLYSNFRIATSTKLLVMESNPVLFSVPRTSSEMILSTPASSISFHPSVSTASNPVTSFTTSLIELRQKTVTRNLTSFYSNPLRVEVQGSDISSGSTFNSLSVSFSSIIIRLKHTSAASYFIFGNSTAQNFTTRCISNEVRTEIFHCKYVRKEFIHRCNGTAGTYVSHCPRVLPSCNNLNMTNSLVQQADDSCFLLNHTETETICQCKFKAENTSRRRLDDVLRSGIFDKSGIADMVASGSYFAADFANTFSATGDLNSSTGAEQSKVVILLVAAIWGSGLCILLFIQFRQPGPSNDKAKEAKPSIKSKRHQKDCHEFVRDNKALQDVFVVRDQIVQYVNSIMPAVYQSQESYFQRCLREIGSHHRYLLIFVDDPHKHTLTDRTYRIMQVLSVQTLTMFLQAVLFDLQNPADDHTCSLHGTETDCLARKTMLDASQTYCKWLPTEEQCQYAPPIFTVKAVMYIMIITAIFTMIFKLPLDYLLQLWVCPVLDVEHVKPSTSHRQVSPNDSSGLNISSYRTYLGFQPFFASLRNSFSFFPTTEHLKAEKQARVVPRNISTHQRRLSSIILTPLDPSKFEPEENNFGIVNKSFENEDLHQSIKRRRLSSIFLYYNNDRSNNNIQSNEITRGPSVITLGSLDRTDSADILDRTIDPTSYDRRITNECCERLLRFYTHQQSRLLLPSTTLQHPWKLELQQRLLSLYEEQWGINPTRISTTTADDIGDSFLPGVFDEVQKTLKSNHRKYRKLNDVFLGLNETSAGLELMHLFIIDLLGQGTTSAKIFQNKFNEDFLKMKIITRFTKYLSIVIILFLNAFFIYYLLLRSVLKGYRWQMMFLRVVITQLVLEMVLLETMECIWIHYIIPDAVRAEVSRAMQILHLIADHAEHFLSGKRQLKIMSSCSPVSFDSTDYLFLSKQLATLRPDLLESRLILAYHNHFPGMICHTWSHYQQILKEKRAIASSSSGTSPSSKLIGATNSHSPGQRFHAFIAENSLGESSTLFTVILTTAAAGIIFFVRFVGLLPTNYQRMVVRLIHTTAFSSLLMYWYTNFRENQLSYIFAFISVVVLLIVFFMIRSFYRPNQSHTERYAMMSGLVDENKSGKLINGSRDGETINDNFDDIINEQSAWNHNETGTSQKFDFTKRLFINRRQRLFSARSQRGIVQNESNENTEDELEVNINTPGRLKPVNIFSAFADDESDDGLIQDFLYNVAQGDLQDLEQSFKLYNFESARHQQQSTLIPTSTAPSIIPREKEEFAYSNPLGSHQHDSNTISEQDNSNITKKSTANVKQPKRLHQVLSDISLDSSSSVSSNRHRKVSRGIISWPRGKINEEMEVSSHIRGQSGDEFDYTSIYPPSERKTSIDLIASLDEKDDFPLNPAESLPKADSFLSSTSFCLDPINKEFSLSFDEEKAVISENSKVEGNSPQRKSILLPPAPCTPPPSTLITARQSFIVGISSVLHMLGSLSPIPKNLEEEKERQLVSASDNLQSDLVTSQHSSNSSPSRLFVEPKFIKRESPLYRRQVLSPKRLYLSSSSREGKGSLGSSSKEAVNNAVTRFIGLSSNSTEFTPNQDKKGGRSHHNNRSKKRTTTTGLSRFKIDRRRKATYDLMNRPTSQINRTPSEIIDRNAYGMAMLSNDSIDDIEKMKSELFASPCISKDENSFSDRLY